MGNIIVMVRYAGFAVLGTFTVMIGLALLSGRINTAHLLDRRRTGASPVFSVDRAQLLVLTLVTAVLYLSKLPEAIATARLAPLPDAALIAIGGSHMLYLVSKLSRRLRKFSAL